MKKLEGDALGLRNRTMNDLAHATASADKAWTHVVYGRYGRASQATTRAIRALSRAYMGLQRLLADRAKTCKRS